MAYPSGQYSNVCVRLIRGKGGQPQHVSGKFVGDVFTCGPFGYNELPERGDQYTITAEHRGETYIFPAVKCWHGARNSCFKFPED